VYIAARSTSRCEGAIQKLLEQTEDMEIGKGGKGKGKLESMVVDLADLGTVKPAVKSFLEKEERLDVLVHNAAVMTPPAGSKDKMVSLTKSFLDVRLHQILRSVTGPRSRIRNELPSSIPHDPPS